MSAPLRAGVGLDFGTTNSAIALASEDGVARMARYRAPEGPIETFRSVLFFALEEGSYNRETRAGPGAIERYLEIDGERRLVQSLKSFLASRLFSATNIFGRNTTLEELVGHILRLLREEAARDLEGASDLHGSAGRPIVVGRPVRFAKSRGVEDDDYAVGRLAAALEGAGYGKVHFEFEPVAAAHHYEQGLERDELVLIADFGGGTSDFCLLPVGPSTRRKRRGHGDIVGTRGVAVAGDSFDARIVRHLIAPELGKGSVYDSPHTPGAEPLPVPTWIYGDLERWHHLSFLRSRKTMALLHELRRTSREPEKIEALLHLVDADLGFELYRAVEATKHALSHHDRTRLVFRDGPVTIDATVHRAEFEGWIASELEAIAGCVDELLAETRTDAAQVDRVFMTGGSAFVPAVRAIFESRFGADKIRGGGELVSVASGLALRALDLCD